MSAILLLAAVTTGATPTYEFDSTQQAVRELAPVVQTGTLLFHQGDCVAVRAFTRSPYTHVAAIVVKQGKPYVYDSGNGIGVRCQTLENYLQREVPVEITLLQPEQSFEDQRRDRFVAELDQRLGTPYSVMHHLTGKRADGVHCAEYVTDVLIACDMITAKSPPRVSPASLREGLEATSHYRAGGFIRLAEAAPAQASEGSWCTRMWDSTKSCTVRCCTQMKRWMFCK